MPTYEYRCDSCEKNFDVSQSFHDDPLTSCPTCGSPVRKVFGNVGIVFKGSGFYKTDSRSGGSGKKPEGDSGTDGKAGTDSSGSEAGAPGSTSSGESTRAPSPSATKSESTSDSKSTSATPSTPAAPAKSSAKEPSS